MKRNFRRPFVGAHVRLISEPIGCTLESLTGTVTDYSDWEGYYVIHLDRPGLFHHAGGWDEPLTDVVEAPDNVIVLGGNG